MPNYTLTISGRKVYTGNLEIERPPVQLYMQKEDRDAQGYLRRCAPCPAVWTLKDDPHALMSRQWQYYLRAINYNMTLENVYLLLDDHLAFANDTGFPSLDDPGEKADFFFNRNTGGKYPGLRHIQVVIRVHFADVPGIGSPWFQWGQRPTIERHYP